MKYGVKDNADNALRLFKSYLDGRTQVVRVGSVSLDELFISTCVSSRVVTAQGDMNNVSSWLRSHKLTVNISKSRIISCICCLVHDKACEMKVTSIFLWPAK